jgi:hypothetical protein
MHILSSGNGAYLGRRTGSNMGQKWHIIITLNYKMFKFVKQTHEAENKKSTSLYFLMLLQETEPKVIKGDCSS